MREIRNTTDFWIPERTAVTFGKFDGVHLGHQELIRALVRQKQVALKTVVFTFATPPAALVEGAEPACLTPYREKRQILEAMGIDYLVEFPFTQEVRQTRAREFIRDVIAGRLQAAYLAVGEDFCFGYNREGTVKTLQSASGEYGYRLDIFQKITYTDADGQNGPVSSTRIKALLREGRTEETNGMLGRPYAIGGRVVHGRALGHTLGFATMNIRPDRQKELPPRGVYFCLIRLCGEIYRGLANLGYRPTVEKDISKSDLLLEVHLLQYNRIVYGEDIEVLLLHYERPEIRFFDIGQLKSQLETDKAACERYFEMRE